MDVFWNGPILELRYGPIAMRIAASRNGRQHESGALAAARAAEEALHAVAPCHPMSRQAVSPLPSSEHLPRALRLMHDAVERAGDRTLTPWAAVAGSIAQVAMEAALAAGARTVTVENGGDIALTAGDDTVIRVGVAQNLADRRPTHVLAVDAGTGIHGVCSSGLGGRSFTRGIAEMVTVAAEDAALADACATIIANAVFADDPAIEQAPAFQLDPSTDIPILLVTTHLGAIAPETLRKALHAGRRKAQGLLAQETILGAVIAVSGLPRVVLPDGFATPYG